MKALKIRDLLFLLIATLALASALIASPPAEAVEARFAAGFEMVHDTDGGVASLTVGVPRYPGVEVSIDAIDDNTFYTASYRFAWPLTGARPWPAFYATVGGGFANDRTHNIGDGFVARAGIGVRLTEYIEIGALHWSSPGVHDPGDNAAVAAVVLPLRL